MKPLPGRNAVPGTHQRDTARNSRAKPAMSGFLDWFERHKYGVIGTLAVHSLLLLLFTIWHLKPDLSLEMPPDMEVEVMSIEDAEQMLAEMENEQLAMATERVTNLTSNITAQQMMASFSPQRLAERVEDDLRRFEQEEFDRLKEERRERGEEVVIPELDPSKWNKERYMDKAAEPVKVEGATTVWHDLEGRVRENDVPGYLCRTQGRVAIRVTVAANGVVQRAEIDPSRSAQADDCMLEHALKSTKRARFSSGPAGQTGTVFFLFLPQ
jgi:hypothetical protein